MHDVGDDGGEETEQHDGRARVHHGVQELPWVLGQGEDSLQILERTQSRPCEQGLCTRQSCLDISGRASPLQVVRGICGVEQRFVTGDLLPWNVSA